MSSPSTRRVVSASAGPIHLIVVALLVSVMTVVSAPLARAAPPGDFQSSLIVGDGLDGPSGFEIAPDGRIFILERSGMIKIFKDGALLPEPFAVLPSEASGDRGLIGIAFDPEFGTANHYVYFYYTGLDLRNRLVRFSAAGDVGTDGPLTIFQTESPSQLLHVGGSIRFGPDGKIYFAVGDNGYPPNAQDLSNPHGKILRINKDGSIPADNPFFGQPGRLGSIWAYGFRNPWRFQFDSATGELYGGDVGDFTWEEINHIARGGNYGWPLKEGACTSSCAGFTDPIHTYPHAGESAAATGGPVYRGSMFPPEYQGKLFFGDYAKGFIRTGTVNGGAALPDVTDFDAQAGSVVDMKVAPDGSLYYLTYFPGALYRITYNTASHVPVANATADVTKGVEPLEVHFSSAGSSDPDGDPITFRWDFGDGTTSTDANPVKTFTAKGVYTVRLTVSDGTGTASAQPIVVQVGLPPTLTVATPRDGDLYNAGDTITFNAFASDAAGFDLDDANIKTEVRLHHGTHFHPFVGPFTGRAGSFTLPTTGEASADTWYEVIVTATDANGLATSKSVRINPRKVDLTFTTIPPGLPLSLDGVPVASPHTVPGVVGFQREISAPPSTTGPDGRVYHFTGWSGGGGLRNIVTTPATDGTVTANFELSGSFTGTYFDNTNLSGAPVVTREDPKIDFLWQGDAPDPALPPDGFSARWTKTQYFAAGRYRFTTVADDGVRLYVDNRLVIDEWHPQPGTPHEFVADLGAGNHTLRMEYFEGGGAAIARLFWDATLEQPGDAFTAEYWNTPGAGGSPSIPATAPTLTRAETAVDHNWAGGSPAPEVDADHFVARWTRMMPLAPGEYEFTVTADDGVRLFVDGERLVDRWIDQGPTSYSARIISDGGPHEITMEYYENAGDAQAHLTYQQVGDPVAPADYQAEYWNVPGGGPWEIPARPADLVRQEASLGADWVGGSPGPEITPDHFVARWTRTDTLPAGLYRFSGVSDDGIRVYVDDALVVNSWQDQHAPFSADHVLAAGPHTIRVEYYENEVGAVAQLEYARVGGTPPAQGFMAEYFDNRNLAGAPVITRPEQAVDFDWGAGSPGAGIPVDQFSARFTQTVTLPAGNYEFTAVGDDGLRLYVDGVPVINRWVDQGPAPHTAIVPIAAGEHTIVLEYYEAFVNAVARLSYQLTDQAPPPPPVPFTAEYFDNPVLGGPPVLTRQDPEIDFNWAEGSPGPAVPVNEFSARWTRTEVYEAGTYRLSAVADDGIRVLVDGVVVVDGWGDHAPTEFTADVPLTAGEHTVVVEYYDAFVDAVARFTQARL
jgi:glucose/arabinose dehydrogenase/PKD repeat protein